MSSTTLDYSNDQAVKRVCIVNRLTQVSLSDNEILGVAKQIQDALKNEFIKYHGFSAKLYYCPKKVQEPKNMWNMYLLDTSDIGGALGYHDANDNGIPQGKAFVKTAMQSGAKWSVTLSHEIFEALADPWGMDNFFSDSGSRKRLVSWEICDPVEADKYAYKKNGVDISNFVTPYWKHPFNDTGEYDDKIRYDLLGKLTKSFQTLKGCHQSYYYIQGGPNGQNGWTDKTFQGESSDIEDDSDIQPAVTGVKNVQGYLDEVSLEDLEGVEMYSPSIYNTNWHIGFKFPSNDMLNKFGITKGEVKEAVDGAFNFAPGSRRDIRFKMSIGGFKSLLKNLKFDKLNDLNNLTQNSGNVFAIDKSFEG